MTKVSRSITINASPEKAFEVITDFENYPQFLPEVKDVVIGNESAKGAVVSFTMHMVKSVKLTLKFKLSKPTTVSWELVQGDMMRSNSGSWKLTKLSGNKTKATYSVDVEFGLLVPNSLGTALIENNLPGMLKNFKKRIEKG